MPVATPADRHGLKAYLDEVRRAPMLSPEDQLVLALRFADTGDEAARHDLVRSNLRLVIKAAFRAGGRNSGQVLDLIQEGNLGLLRAVEMFDPHRGVPFAAYATYWIRATLYRYLMNRSRVAKLGTTRNGRKMFFQLEKERRRLRTGSHEPTPRELAEALDVPESEVIQFEQLLRTPMSLDEPDESGRTWSNSLSDDEAVNPEQAASRGLLRERVRGEIHRFSATLDDARERSIWEERLLAEEPTTLAELGNRHGVSKERIRQIETRLKRHARDWLYANLGPEVEDALAA